MNGDGALGEEEISAFVKGLGGPTLDSIDEVKRGAASALAALDSDRDDRVGAAEMRGFAARVLTSVDETRDWARHAIQVYLPTPYVHFDVNGMC